MTSPGPTLWRTCRVLANRNRLKILALLASESPQTVSSVGLRLGLSLPVASQYLRALEARTLLIARRSGRRVEYRLKPAKDGGHELGEPLRRALGVGNDPAESVFRFCTAFTHPRRIDIFRTLKAEPRTLAQLQVATRIPLVALWRHLGKLEARGLVTFREGLYAATNPEDPVGRALARLAG
jgi:DNA-binding transcriptional ArsR family regulator